MDDTPPQPDDHDDDVVVRWNPEPWTRLTDDERDRVHERLAELSDERAARVEAHRETLRRVAFRLGRDVATGTRLVADAARQIDRYVYMFDPETPVPVLLVPADEARRIADDAFAAGVRKARAQ